MLAQCVSVGLAGGAGVGLANYVMEMVFFYGLHWMEQQGMARRLSKITSRQFEEHPWSNFWAVALPYMPLYWLVAVYSHGPDSYLIRMDLSLDPVPILTYIWYADSDSGIFT